MPNFNLITDPWIPVRWLDPSRREPLVGLDRLFAEAEAIADLSANPAERVSLMRLLVCIAQAALGAPPHPQAWAGFGDDLVTTVPEYLDRPEIRERFELFGDGARFLQTSKIESQIKPASFAKLVFHFATGSTSTLFDHEGESTRVVAFDFLARSLLTFQNFLVGGSFGRFLTGNGPSLKMLHTILIGKSLRETILLNCLDEETMKPTSLGRPIWEIPEKAVQESTLTTTYLGRLVPSPAKLWLINDGTHVRIGHGLNYPEFGDTEFREPSATVCISAKEKDRRYLLRANVDRGIWRDLHAVAISGKQAPSGPLTLTSHRAAFENDDAILWTGELIKNDKKAIIVDSVESVFTIPPSLLDFSGRELYESGVIFATSREVLLKDAVEEFFKFLDGRKGSRFAKPSQSAKSGKQVASTHYWHALDRDASVLLGLVADPDAMMDREFGKWSKGKPDRWTAIVRAALASAYNSACPRQNARQFEAYAAGLRVLFPKLAKAKKTA